MVKYSPKSLMLKSDEMLEGYVVFPFRILRDLPSSQTSSSEKSLQLCTPLHTDSGLIQRLPSHRKPLHGAEYNVWNSIEFRFGYYWNKYSHVSHRYIPALEKFSWDNWIINMHTLHLNTIPDTWMKWQYCKTVYQSSTWKRCNDFLYILC